MMSPISKIKWTALTLVLISWPLQALADDYAFSHCWRKPRTLHDMLFGVDHIVVGQARLLDSTVDAEWDLVALDVGIRLRGKIGTDFRFPAVLLDPARQNYLSTLNKHFSRAASHGSPKFLAKEVRLFDYSFDIIQVELVDGKERGKSLIPLRGTCARVPVLLSGFDYLFMFDGDTLVSVEPIFSDEDYWLRFIEGIIDENYWPLLVE